MQGPRSSPSMPAAPPARNAPSLLLALPRAVLCPLSISPQPHPVPPPWSSSPPSHAAHSEGFTEAGADAISCAAFAWRPSYLIPASPRVRLAGGPTVVFLCFPFISPFLIRSRASATSRAGAPSLLPPPPCSHQPLPLPGHWCPPGAVPCSQPGVMPTRVPRGPAFPPAPSSLGRWRHRLPFAFTPGTGRTVVWLPAGSCAEVRLRVPICPAIPACSEHPLRRAPARSCRQLCRHWGHRCHPMGTLALSLPRTSLAPGPSHPPGFQLLQSHRSHLCTYGPLSAVITDML